MRWILGRRSRRSRRSRCRCVGRGFIKWGSSSCGPRTAASSSTRIRKEPQAVLNIDFFGFRLLIAGLTAGDLDLTPSRAITRAKWAVESVVPPADNTQLLSHHKGWRDATDQVYNDHRLGEQLRKYRRRAADDNPTGSR
jgi:hypothetical protein